MRMIQQSWAWYTHNTILRYFEIGFTYQICLETLIVCMWMGQPLRVSHMNRGEQHSATPTVAQLCWCENQDFDPDPNEVDGRNHPQNGWQSFTRIYMDSHGVIGMMLLKHPTEKEDLGSPWNRGCWAFQIVSFGTKHECIQCMYCPSIPVCLPVCLSRSTPKPAKYADACSLVDIHRYPRTINELFFSWSFMTYPVYESWTSWVSNDLLVILCLGTVLYPLLYNIILFDIICVYSFTHYCWLWSGGLPGLTASFARRCVESCKMCSWRTAKRRCRGKKWMGRCTSEPFGAYSAHILHVDQVCDQWCWHVLTQTGLKVIDGNWVPHAWQRAHYRFLG